MRNFIEYGDYMPHGMCLLWQPWLVLLWAGSDLLIFLSYMAIPIALLTVLKRRGDIPHRGLVLLFASFIMLCGFTHLAGIVTLWYPIYPWVGALKLATGIVSCVTAIVLFRLIPTLVALPSPAKLQGVNEELWAEMSAHETTLASLESQVAERTEELQRVNALLAVQAREAVHRSGNLLSVVSSLASQSAKEEGTKEEFTETLLGRLRTLAKATAMVQVTQNQSSADLETLVREQLRPLTDIYADRVKIEGPSVRAGSEAAQQLCLALHELATNAQKYNMAYSHSSRIALSWTLEEESSGEARFELCWREDLSSELPVEFAEQSREGFGTKLLMRIVPAMLKGRADRAFEGGEFHYRLSAPLSAIGARADESDGTELAARLVDESFGLEPKA